MKKSSKLVDVYEPNKNVRVTVNNTPKTDKQTGEITYKRSVTIKINADEGDKLSFVADDSIAKYIETISFEEEQTSLL